MFSPKNRATSRLTVYKKCMPEKVADTVVNVNVVALVDTLAKNLSEMEVATTGDTLGKEKS